MSNRTVVLAATWHPRGELSRLVRLMPQLKDIYQELVLVVPPQTSPDVLDVIAQGFHPVVASDWSGGRYLALQKTLEFNCTHVHYADLDRLIRWIETRPEEWLRVVDLIKDSECLVIGRTPQAYATHPQALITTEAISNLAVSTQLGINLDVSAGSKGFCRQAVEYIIRNCKLGHALGADAEWLVVLHRAGFTFQNVLVDGLDWESADRYIQNAADPRRQRQAAEEYDTDPAHWKQRVAVAMEIIRMGIDASRREINERGN